MSKAPHPYRQQPDRAFWARAVAQGFDAAQLPSLTAPLFTAADKLVSAGSCFAANMVPWLEKAGLQYLRCEPTPAAFNAFPEALGYDLYSAAYGNIYTARQMRQLLDRALGLFQPMEDRWHEDKRVVDPFRPGLRYAARSDAEFEALTRQHLNAVRRAFSEASVVVFTLGLTEGWVSLLDGAVYPACPGTIAGSFDAARHDFHNFSVAETRDDLLAFHDRLREINPAARLILTVSPVPLVATATDRHVVEATILSKSILRAAVAEAQAARPEIGYFPAYEIVTGPQAPEIFFEADRRDVSRHGVACVMNALLAHCEAPERAAALAMLEEWCGGQGPAPVRQLQAPSLGLNYGLATGRYQTTAAAGTDPLDADCEEMMVANIVLAQRLQD